jgi:hypothetical protein
MMKMMNFVNWEWGKTPPRERLRVDNSTLSALLSFLQYTYYRDMKEGEREQGLVVCDVVGG